jgi:hypothetical protein
MLPLPRQEKTPSCGIFVIFAEKVTHDPTPPKE